MAYPVQLILEGLKCVVVGGGKVAGRKAAALRLAGLLHRLTGLSLADIVIRRQRILAVVAGGAVVGLVCYAMLGLLYVERGPALTASIVCFVGTSILFRLLDLAIQRYLARPGRHGRDARAGRNGPAA